ncbi:Ca-activated chloride channel family protein [Roseimicrobium gellanilyticum]|uniref:Ca-activated chloride channel family protein n=1 Tax=Roseimicrobium gellanilyticum TaxID=748857 RepID=A0A366H0K5_9BACT|nr:tetratricopeptide repeat protein [Roseimicrobium gellanilyticum]RBP35371.1 Ca-activated chloride channel family protein [Roseimicrobium gellanilyticum]
MSTSRHQHKSGPWIRRSVWAGLGMFVIILIIGTVRDPHYWMKADRRGEILMYEKKFVEAAKAYEDPWHVAAAQYRSGDFEAAAKTFARVPGAPGAFNQGNAWLMHGKYDAAIASYDRALGFKPKWKDAEDNKALAMARKKKMEDSGKDRDKESTEAYKPDEIVFDNKGGDKPPEKPHDLNGDKMSDEELRASWLRRVQTTPGDFLRAKFAYQASQQAKGASTPPKEGAK